MKTKLNPLQVFDRIETELAYLLKKWNENTTVSNNQHSVEEWLMYVEDYLNEAKHILSREARQTANPKALDNCRKMAAMLVVCMQQHGVNYR